MKHFICCLLALGCAMATAQSTISGTLSPAEDYQWLLAYRLKPGSQVYVKDTKVNNGSFSLALPADAQPGIYRIVYAIPQEEYYFDVIYNGKEAVELSFDETNGIAFTTSRENILFRAYFKEISTIEQQLISFYKAQSTNTKKFMELANALKTTQQAYMEKSKGLICHEFIKANNPYIPEQYIPLATYVKKRKQHYFTYLDFKNETLQSSVYLTDKVVNYVMTALPLEPLTPEGTEKVMQQNVNKVDYYTQGLDTKYKTHLYYNLWLQTSASGFNATADFIYNTYLKSLANQTNNSEIIANIEQHNRLRIGAIPPDIVWKENKATRKLSTVEGAAHYVLVFWSSTCGHCLNELPKLHQSIATESTVKVIAVGLEDGEENWEIEAAKLEHFTHVIAPGKWDSTYAEAYNIEQTPTYFILDKDKKIVAKPEDYSDVLEFLKGE